jgi:hypothetical protein
VSPIRGPFSHPLTCGDSLPITSAVMTIQMAMTDRDASHGASSTPTTNPSREKGVVDPLRVSNVCLLWLCPFVRVPSGVPFRCANAMPPRRGGSSVINDGAWFGGAHRLAHATMKRRRELPHSGEKGKRYVRLCAVYCCLFRICTKDGDLAANTVRRLT